MIAESLLSTTGRMLKKSGLWELGRRSEEILGNVLLLSFLAFLGAVLFATGFLGLFNYGSEWSDPAIWATGFFPYWIISIAIAFTGGRWWFVVSCGLFIAGTLFMIVAVQYQWTNLTPEDVKSNALFGNAHLVLLYLFTLVSVPIAIALAIYTAYKIQKSRPPMKSAEGRAA